MKLPRIALLPLIAWASVVIFVPAATAQGPIAGAAKVLRISGSARYTMGQFIWQPVKAGDVLRPGAMIQTSSNEDSYVDLALGDSNAVVRQTTPYRPGIESSLTSSTISFQPTAEQNVIRIGKDSIVGIDKVSVLQTGSEPVTETELELKRGRLAGNVKKLAAGSKYQVKFVNGVAAVRGTVFEIQAQGVLEVYVGSMVVAWVDPKTQKVTTQTVIGGQAYDAPSNQVSSLSPSESIALEQLSTELLVTVFEPGFVTLASDRTAIGMSPVGARPGSVPTAANASGAQNGGVVLTFTSGPPGIGSGAH